MKSIEKYNEIKIIHSDFKNIEIDEKRLFEDKIMEWDYFLILTLVATICIMATTASIIVFCDYVNNSNIFDLFQHYSKINLYNQKWLRYTLLAGCVALFTYTWILPDLQNNIFIKTARKLWNYFRTNILHRYSQVPQQLPFCDLPPFQYMGDKKGFILYTWISLYVIIFALFSLFSHKLTLDSHILKLIFTVLVIIPIIISSFIVSAFLSIGFFYSRLKKHIPINASNKLILYLIDAIYLCDNFTKTNIVSIENKHELISSIETASQYLHEIELYFENRLGKGKVEFSIKPLRNYLFWVYSPEKSTFVNLSNELCVYLKAAITGNYHYMPSIQKTPNRNKKTSIYFGIYLTIPLIGYLLFKNYFGHTMDNDMKNMFYIFYGIWTFIGLSIFMSNVNDDNFVIFKDLVRSVLKIK